MERGIMKSGIVARQDCFELRRSDCTSTMKAPKKTVATHKNASDNGHIASVGRRLAKEQHVGEKNHY